MSKYTVGIISIFLAGLLAAFALTVTNAAGVWTHRSTTIASPFYTAWTHHQKCGKEPSGPVTRGYYGAYHQRFPHCEMTFSRVFVKHLGATATPPPTRTPLPTVPAPPVATRIPTPAPTATTAAIPTAVPTQTAVFVPQPTSTALPPTPLPIPTAIPPTDPVAYELSLMNQTRAQYGLQPYTLNLTQSNGTATCAGSLGHSQAMAQSGQIWHQNASYPAASFPTSICVPVRSAGENVGEGTVFGDPRPMLQQLHISMMNEGTANCGAVISHACNVVNPQFTSVGIGIYVSGGSVWLTVDFLG